MKRKLFITLILLICLAICSCTTVQDYGEKKGNFVLMEHSDGTQTLYCHCSEILVTEGSVIRAGELIALVGNTGWSTGPHLHFEIRIDGSSVDPLDYIKEKDGRV